MQSLRERKGRRRAFTLVELVVTMSIMVITSGLILGILIETHRSTTKAQTRLTMQIKAERTADNITSILQAAVAPSSLDAPAGKQPVFSANNCALIHSKRFLTSDAVRKGIEWVDIRTLTGGPNEKNPTKTVAIQHTPLQQPGAENQPAKTAPPTFDSRYSVSVNFKYATELITVGLEPNFKDALQAQEYPRLIQVRVRVEDAEKKLDPYELVTAVKML